MSCSPGLRWPDSPDVPTRVRRDAPSGADRQLEADQARSQVGRSLDPGEGILDCPRSSLLSTVQRGRTALV